MLVRLVLIFCFFFCGATAANCSYGGTVSTKELCIHIDFSWVTWDNAESICVQRGGHLASLHSQFDTNILLELAVTESCQYVLIGGKVLSQNASWSDGTRFDYTAWADDNHWKDGCVHAFTLPNQHDTGFWSIDDCTTKYPCFACETPQMMSDCADFYRAGYTDNGMYRIWVDGDIHNVFCDMGNGGGWTVFQSRFLNIGSFESRTWKEYQNGFIPNLTPYPLEYNSWMGLDLLHHLTAKDSDVTLRIELVGDRAQESMTNAFWYIEYTKFKIAGHSNNYQLTSLKVDSNRRNTSLTWDPMMYSLGGNFSAVDKVNDPMSDCIVTYKMGGWWSNNCALSSLNGDYDYSNADGYGMFWMTDLKTIIHPSQTRMMLRPTSFSK